MLKYIRSLHVQDNNQCELLRAQQIVNACDQCVKTINISDNASPCLHELQSPSQRFFSDYALMSYFAKIFPDLSNRKKSIKTRARARARAWFTLVTVPVEGLVNY